jgi:hypothetical protein
MDIRKVALMKELQKEFYTELKRKKNLHRSQRGGVFICLVLVGVLIAILLA